MRKITHALIEKLCPRNTDVAADKLNKLLNTMHMESHNICDSELVRFIYQISKNHKADNDNDDYIFMRLMDVVYSIYFDESIEACDYLCDEGCRIDEIDVLIGHAVHILDNKIDEDSRSHRLPFHLSSEICATPQKASTMSTGEVVVDVAILFSGEPARVAEIKFDLIDMAFDVYKITNIMLRPFPIWTTDFEEYPEAISEPLIIKNIKRGIV